MDVNAGPLDESTRQAVLSLIVTYNRRLDDGDVEGLVALFTADGELRAMGQSATGADEIRTLLASVPRARRPLTQHLVSNVVMDAASGLVRVESDFTVVDRGTEGFRVRLAGRYRDEVVADSGQWHFRHREAVALGPALT